MAEIKNISTNLVLLDTDNPRFGDSKATSQVDAIQKMLSIDNMVGKIFNLARDIAENGLDPGDLPLVIETQICGKKRYLTVEGNRRVLAIKMLLNPDLMQNSSRKVQLRELANAEVINAIKEIPCSVLTSREEAARWIELRHTGENDGVGRVNWDGITRETFRNKQGEPPATGKQILSFIQRDEYFDDDLKKAANNIMVTNLTRLFQGTPAQNSFGLQKKRRMTQSFIPLEKLRDIVECVIRIMSDSDFNMKDIYHKSDQINFIKNRIPSDLLPTKADLLEEAWDISTFDQSSMSTEQRGKQKQKKARKNSKADRKNRKHLIDSILVVPEHRINSIYGELRKLEVHEYPNAVAVLFRVFLELSCDHFLGENNVRRSDNNRPINIGEGIVKLKIKVLSIIKHLKVSGALKNSECRMLEANAKNELDDSIESLNQYVHSPHLNPIASELNLRFDNWLPMFREIWK